MTFTKLIGSKDWNGYTIFTDGRIWNKNGTDKSFKKSKKGYLFTNFYYNKKLNTHQIHKVIWLAWKGVIPDGYEIDHIDNNRENNALDNLQLLTKSENNRKAYLSGNRNFVFGDTNPNSKYRKQLRKLNEQESENCR